jgi:DNA-binding NarL/FixJ family response regulator
MSKKITILIVDDQRLMRDGLRILLELEDDLAVVGEAENGRQALTAFETLRPDVVLMDIRMPEMNGVEAVRELRARWGDDAKVIILTTFDDDEYIFEGLRVGALGYLLKDVSGDELTDAIRTVAAGGALIDPSVTRKVVAEFARMGTRTPSRTAELDNPLSERELEILGLLAKGLTNKEIATRLYLAEGTVKNYVSNLLQKMNVRDRTQAVIRGQELGLLK